MTATDSTIEDIASPDVRVLAYTLLRSLQGEPLPDAGSEDFDRIREALASVVRLGSEQQLQQVGLAALRVLHGHLHAHVRTAQAILQQRKHISRGGPLQ